MGSPQYGQLLMPASTGMPHVWQQTWLPSLQSCDTALGLKHMAVSLLFCWQFEERSHLACFHACPFSAHAGSSAVRVCTFYTHLRAKNAHSFFEEAEKPQKGPNYSVVGFQQVDVAGVEEHIVGVPGADLLEVDVERTVLAGLVGDVVGAQHVGAGIVGIRATQLLAPL